jgi:ketosteroid isomerase-like protein
MSSDSVTELTEIEHKLAAAFVVGDPSFHESVLADDWSVIDPAGRILTKAQVLRESFTGERDLTGKIDEVNVRDFGDWAIVTGRTHISGRFEGQEIDVTLRFTDIFSRATGRWKCQASQGTMLSE